MNVGRNIALLKEVAGFKDYQEFGRFVDINGGWLLDLSKKQEIITVDITRLLKLTNKFNITLEQLLFGDISDTPTMQFPEDDLATLLNKVQEQINTDIKFEGTPLTDETSKLAYDSIEVVKKILRQNI
jgi:hypothetical protein